MSPSVPDTAVWCFTYTCQKTSRKHVKDYFYTISRSQQPAVVWVQALAHAGSFWLSHTDLSSSWDQEWDLLGCYLGLAISQSWQGEMLSRCKKKAEKDLSMLTLG